ncbi:MAG: cell division protein ZapA [Bacteroidales bacterium]|nr:cell division protein ZapA [Bacteroidales bacterium]
METIPVTVTILDRKYKLNISREEEAFLRKAAQAIDSQAKNYGKLYAYKDHQDLLAMVALTQITQLTKIQENAYYKDTQLTQHLTTINNLLDQATQTNIETSES